MPEATDRGVHFNEYGLPKSPIYMRQYIVRHEMGHFRTGKFKFLEKLEQYLGHFWICVHICFIYVSNLEDTTIKSRWKFLVHVMIRKLKILMG